MKKITQKEFDSIESCTRRKPGVHCIKARKLILEFIESGEDIMEITASDFDDAFDFNDVKQRNKAAGFLRSKLETSEFSRKNIGVTVKGGRIFLRRVKLSSGRTWLD